MKGARFGALAVALVMAFAGCSSRPTSLLSPAGGKLLGRGALAATAHILTETGTQDTIALPFGAGVAIRVVLTGASGNDTTSSKWTYRWSTDADVIQLDRTSATGDPTNNLVLLGTSDLQVKSRRVLVTVVEQDSASTDTIAQAVLAVGFKRAPPRDVTGLVRIYHRTWSLGGSISANRDSATAEFHNNDADNTLLRAGIVGISGQQLSEHHSLLGQTYSGPILFKIPGLFELSTTGPDKDPKSQVQGVVLDTPGPPNELVMTYPDNRFQISRDADLEIQWSGGVGDFLRFPRNPAVVTRGEVHCTDAPDTVCVPVELTLQLTDITGRTITVQAPDNGSFTIERSQLQQLVPGMITTLIAREADYPTLVVGGSGAELSVTTHIIEENHSSFFLK